MHQGNHFKIISWLDCNASSKKQEFSAMQSPMTIGDYSILVRNLTEDQRKVISFYIAIMNSPKIVVLDQPVAGCDPLYKY